MGSQRLPLFTLALLLAVAACVVLGGVAVSRRAESVRLPRDRRPLQEFGTVMEEQTRRLERLYESHLRRIAEALDVRNTAPSRSQSERIVGIRQLSVLRGKVDPKPDQHIVTMKSAHGEKWPEPTLRARREGLPRPVIMLSESEFLHDQTERRGWVDRPGQPLFYWQRQDWENVVIVFSLDRKEVGAAIDGWLRAWLGSGVPGVFGSFQTAGGSDRLLGTRGDVLGAAGAAPARPEQPDFLLPLRGRFGTWQLAAWDRYELRTSYHTPTLVASSILGLFTALLGTGIFVQQLRASALAEQRVSFVNRVSHELRTPLTNILLNADLAAEALDDGASESTRRLGLVQEEARRLGRLIDNVLTFSRNEQKALRLLPRACVPASVIDAVVEQFAASFARRALIVERLGEVGRPCLLDADALAQILGNLLSNVEKYVPGGSVIITSQHEEETLIISVCDDGPGILPRDAERVFRPFERLGSAVTEGASGTGLGLGIARDLAAAMGGSLRLLPSEHGAAFELRLPAPPIAQPSILSA